MADQAVIVYIPHDQRGHEILDELEERTGRKGAPSDHAPEAREYWITGAGASARAFEPMLDKVEVNWRDHVSSPTPD